MIPEQRKSIISSARPAALPLSLSRRHGGFQAGLRVHHAFRLFCFLPSVRVAGAMRQEQEGAKPVPVWPETALVRDVGACWESWSCAASLRLRRVSLHRHAAVDLRRCRRVS